MRYYSTNNQSLRVSLKDAVTLGLAPDRGLFLPEHIPTLPQSFFDKIDQLSFLEVAYEVAAALIGEDIPARDLKKLVNKAFPFDAPVFEVESDVYALELFHGPTLAFKDFGARFMSQLLGYFNKASAQTITVLVATSGDTGGAVAHGFLGVPNTRVVVLYPSGMVSDIQERQFTTLGKNVQAAEVKGTFDDCQRLVKEAFADEQLRERHMLTSANSINVARLLPQSFYYFFAYAQLKKHNRPIIFSVPSGNLGNLTAGLLARRMGLPASHFVAATNSNDVFPEYLQTLRYRPRPSVPTISNAMDVGDPSNFVRILDLYQGNTEALLSDLSGYAFNDKETKTAMRRVFVKHNYIMDPHGAIGYLGLKKAMAKRKGQLGVFLETAHPGKFRPVVEDALKDGIELPSKLLQLLEKEKKVVQIDNRLDQLRELLLN
ncbi:MAG: threonine synthase [Cyclobacteriaceae bacterium]